MQTRVEAAGPHVGVGQHLTQERDVRADAEDVVALERAVEPGERVGAGRAPRR